jgi:hypothetical protein
MPQYSITEAASGSGDTFVSLPPRATPVSVSVNGSAGSFTVIPGIGLTITFPAVSDGDTVVTTYSDEPPVAPSGGSIFSNGDGIDQTQTVSSETRVFDIRGKSRPVMLNFTVASGDQLDMFTTTDPDALTDADHPSWTVERAASSFSVIEVVGSPNVVGIRIRRMAGSGTSTVRIYAPLRGPGYNPVFDPFYDVAPAGLNDVRRFLDQATMGPTVNEAATVLASGNTFGEWLEAQFARSAPTLPAVQSTVNFNNASTRGIGTVLSAGWTENNDDQLRLRVAYVLGQIIPVGFIQNSSNPNLRSWNQRLIENAFGNYADILKLSITHRAMGWYLNNLGNSAWNGTPPSQNFARELVQLFSLGVYARNKDGTIILSSSGQPVYSYTQDDINAIARYLSGWNQRGAVIANPGVNGTPVNGDMETSKALGQNLAYNGPALPVLGFTEVDYPALAESSDPSDAQIIARADAIVDIIMRQQTTGAYICKQMIQKMVTDDPSPEYVRRVVAAWENNGSGVRGDLKAVVRAILLDSEARGNSKPAEFGRAQEWALSVTRRMRYAEILANDVSVNNGYAWGSNNGANDPRFWIADGMGQGFGLPRSIFNDYPFDFKLGDISAPAAALWDVSSMQVNVGAAMAGSQRWGDSAALAANNDAFGRAQVTALIALYDATVAATAGDTATKALAGHEAVLDKVYADLHQGDVPTGATRTALLAFLTSTLGSSVTTRRRCTGLINLVLAIPRAAVVR